MSQFLEIAETVFRTHARPLKPREITDLAKDDQLFSDKLAGKTPWQTMKAKISVDIRRKAENSRFVRTAPNTFFLRDLLTDAGQTYAASRQIPAGSREFILTLPSSILDIEGRFQGISRGWRSFIKRSLTDSTCQPLLRLDAELREDRKQLLTYILVTRGHHLLCFRRGTFNRVEDYLRGSLCVGFGGHVSEGDRTLYNAGDYQQVIYDNAARELLEELRFPEIDKRRLLAQEGLDFLGVLNDDSSATGRKHIAIVLKYEVSRSPQWQRPQRGEKSITQLTWLDLRSFNRELREFEYWSQLCLTEFFKDAVATQASFIVRRKAPFHRKHILCVLGGIGSGKSAATEIMKHEFGYSEINSGKIVAKLLGIPAVPKTNREEFQKRAWKMIRRSKGPASLASAILAEAGKIDGPVLIDGIRQRETLSELKRQANPTSVAVVYVHTPPHIAYQFYQERQGRNVDISRFISLCEAPVEADVKKLIGDADAVLYNWSGKLKYEQAVRQLMRELSLR